MILRISNLYTSPVRDNPKNVICTPSEGSINVYLELLRDNLGFMQNMMRRCLFATVNMSVCVICLSCDPMVPLPGVETRFNLDVEQTECTVWSVFSPVVLLK